MNKANINLDHCITNEYIRQQKQHQQARYRKSDLFHLDQHIDEDTNNNNHNTSIKNNFKQDNDLQKRAEQHNTIHQRLKINNKSRILNRQSLNDIGYGQLSSYRKIQVIGSGSYSNVYKATSLLTNKLVALKEISLQRDEGVPFTAIREVSLLKELKHPNIVTLHDFIYTPKSLSLVFEYLDFDLSTYMCQCEYKVAAQNVKLFLYQLLKGIKYCHDKRILHRDLKPQNLLLNLLGELKLADFGLARSKSVPIKTFTDEVVTLWYRPPDVLLGNTDYGPSIDMWGVGCIFYELCIGKTLFTGASAIEQLKLILETIGIPREEDWPSFKDELKSRDIQLVSKPICDFTEMRFQVGQSGIDLFKKFLKTEPKMRISAHEAMKQQYFKTLPDEIHRLADSQSIFSIDSIRFIPDKMIKQTFPIE